MPTVLILPEVLRETSGRHVEILQQAGFEVCYPKNPQIARGRTSEEEVIAELVEADATLASSERYSAAVLAQLPKLRVIARNGVGYDAVDVAAATARRVALTITPTANHDAVAELALALLFAVAKSLVPHDRAVRTGQWPRVLLQPLRHRTLGILGLGRIGRSLARRARALGMELIATETAPDLSFVQEHSVQLVDLDSLLERSDFLSIHCPLTDATRGLFNHDLFGRMKPGSILINTARGPLVDEDALLDALQSGQLAGAGLDVFDQEPPRRDHPLFACDNVVLSPHLGGVDEISLEAMAVEAAACIVQLYRGQWPTAAVVNRELQSDWSW